MKKLNIFMVMFTVAIFNVTHIAQAQVGFDSVSYFPVIFRPNSVISADFNGDTKADLAVVNSDSSLSILLGNGAGSFGSATNFSVGNGSQSVISADFNGDGKADLAVATWHGGISILLGDGIGNFASFVTFSAGSSPQSIISADFNGDGKADLAIANSGSNNVSILLGDGLGGFGAATNFSVGTNPYSIINADFNGDGKVDLAVANPASNNISILLGNGLGSFAGAINIAVGNGPLSLISADFNGDGKADLAIANENINNVSVLLGNGTGGFGSAVNFPAGSGLRSITSADFNGDGKADLAAAGTGKVSILLGDGTGNFGSTYSIIAGYLLSSITSADFNGDSKPDLAIANWADSNYPDNVAILINNPLSAIPVTPPICLVTVDSTHTHNTVVWEKSNLNMAAVDSFIVYREITTNNYQPIGFVLYDSLSIFNDLGANPAATGYRYELKSKSAHGVKALDFSPYHNTMYLTNNGANFSWTPYEIENTTTPVSAYYIYRDNNSTGNFQSIGNTTGNQTGFTDVNYSSYPNASYYVEAIMTSGTCHPTRSSFNGSISNVKYIGSSGVLQLNNNSAINVYPNPTSNTLNIEGITGKIALRLYDVVGKLVMEKELENNTIINTSQLTEGIYTLLMENKIGRTFSKIVISR